MKKVTRVRSGTCDLDLYVTVRTHSISKVTNKLFTDILFKVAQMSLPL